MRSNSIKTAFLVLLLFGSRFSVLAQSQETQQLLLNVEKLSQLKNILQDMKRGYEVISRGYNAVKNIAHGNFSLHEVFLDGLWLVGPEVRKYYKIAEIVRDQASILSEYKSAYGQFSGSGTFSTAELDYLSGVYGKLFKESLDNLDQLALVITASKLRMSDDERLEAIDGIFADTRDKLAFLRSFNRKASLLYMQRKKEMAVLKDLGNYFNLDKP